MCLWLSVCVNGLFECLRAYLPTCPCPKCSCVLRGILQTQLPVELFAILTGQLRGGQQKCCLSTPLWSVDGVLLPHPPFCPRVAGDVATLRLRIHLYLALVMQICNQRDWKEITERFVVFFVAVTLSLPPLSKRGRRGRRRSEERDIRSLGRNLASFFLFFIYVSNKMPVFFSRPALTFPPRMS